MHHSARNELDQIRSSGLHLLLNRLCETEISTKREQLNVTLGITGRNIRICEIG